MVILNELSMHLNGQICRFCTLRVWEGGNYGRSYERFSKEMIADYPSEIGYQDPKRQNVENYADGEGN